MSESQEAFVPGFTNQAASRSVLIFVTRWSGLIPVCEPSRQVEHLPAGGIGWCMEVSAINASCLYISTVIVWYREY